MKKCELERLIGTLKTTVFYEMIEKINSLYEMDQTWNNGGKRWDYEYKFRRGGKTLCAFYFKENVLGLMIIFGATERTKLEEIRENLTDETLREYDESKTFHDGKWVMFDVNDISQFNDFEKLLLIKRKPNKR